MTEKRKANRVAFSRGISAFILGLDGTWRRSCTVHDISAGGAKILVEGSIQGLMLKEFFLLLSSTGLAYRRCALAWVNGDVLGVRFLSSKDEPDKKKAPAKAS